MTSEEKVMFLKKMGYGGSVLRAAQGYKPERKKPHIVPGKMPKNHVSKQDLIDLYNIFNKKDL